MSGAYLTELTLSLPRVINAKFLLQPHQKYYITQYKELLAFHSLLRLGDDHTIDSHNLTIIHFSSKGWENVLFELGSERVNPGLINGRFIQTNAPELQLRTKEGGSNRKEASIKVPPSVFGPPFRSNSVLRFDRSPRNGREVGRPGKWRAQDTRRDIIDAPLRFDRPSFVLSVIWTFWFWMGSCPAWLI